MKKLIDLFIAGGPVMWPILILSLIGVAILIAKALELHAGRKSRRGLVIVSTIITAEPMLGILGTVTGIMQTFGALSSDGASSPLAATSGIGEALTTTAAGLITSLILLFPYNWLDNRLSEDDEPAESAK